MGSEQSVESDVVQLSPEVTAVIGAEPHADLFFPGETCALVFSGEEGAPSALHVAADAKVAWSIPVIGERRLVLIARRSLLSRLGGDALLEEAGGFHLPSSLREVVAAILASPVSPMARAAYRLAKCIELLCETLKRHDADELLPLAGDGGLSEADTRRVMAARRLIDERCGEKLTLDSIARSCGLNRSKLTRGFRELFACSVAEALAERRLDLAKRMLLTTNKPVACVGYEAGYLNNASFARAFGRRFGRTPSDFRARPLAA